MTSQDTCFISNCPLERAFREFKENGESPADVLIRFLESYLELKSDCNKLREDLDRYNQNKRKEQV
jgi:hypothetical protein